MKLNYFKTFNEVKVDFEKLTLHEQYKELELVRNNYHRQLVTDTQFGVETSQTKNTGKLLNILEKAHEKHLETIEQ